MLPTKTTPTNIPKQEKPPTEERLKLLLSQGPELVDIVQIQIDKWKLPYFIELQPDGSGILKNKFSQGELYLQQFITEEQDMLVMKSDAYKVANTPYEVLITGPTGTGKEIIAKSMIGNKKGHIKAVNCAGLPEHLIESELFGHVKGAFTGADKDKQGLMAAASDGVMFLDEIGELPMSVQSKLLRALQEHTIRKVGSNIDETITCKFVCATHRDLRQMTKLGTFREDLYARISTLELKIKPLLPDRICDIIPITKSIEGGEEFLTKYQVDLLNGLFDLSLNVRSLRQHVIRYRVLGRVTRLTM